MKRRHEITQNRVECELLLLWKRVRRGEARAEYKARIDAANARLKRAEAELKAAEENWSQASQHPTFVLQHSGTIDRGAPSLVISVVPDSGTGELVGLAGTMTITIEDGKHSYALDYTLPGNR